jgi:hypothetical protein
VMPVDHMSALVLYFSSFMISGAIHSGAGAPVSQ